VIRGAAILDRSYIANSSLACVSKNLPAQGPHASAV
jgi:hypothetical protein